MTSDNTTFSKQLELPTTFLNVSNSGVQIGLNTPQLPPAQATSFYAPAQASKYAPLYQGGYSQQGGQPQLMQVTHCDTSFQQQSSGVSIHQQQHSLSIASHNSLYQGPQWQGHLYVSTPASSQKRQSVTPASNAAKLQQKKQKHACKPSRPQKKNPAKVQKSNVESHSQHLTQEKFETKAAPISYQKQQTVTPACNIAMPQQSNPSQQQKQQVCNPLQQQQSNPLKKQQASSPLQPQQSNLPQKQQTCKPSQPQQKISSQEQKFNVENSSHYFIQAAKTVPVTHEAIPLQQQTQSECTICPHQNIVEPVSTLSVKDSTQVGVTEESIEASPLGKPRQNISGVAKPDSNIESPHHLIQDNLQTQPSLGSEIEQISPISESSTQDHAAELGGTFSLRQRSAVKNIAADHIKEGLYELYEKEEVDLTPFQKGVNSCCLSIKFNFRNPCSKKTNQNTRVMEKETLGENLEKGCGSGSRVLGRLMFPLVNKYVRAIWISAEVVLALIGFGLSIGTFSIGDNPEFNILHLVLSVISVVLALLDAGTLILSCCLKKSAFNSNSAGSCCCGCFETVSDVVRTILTETILIPLLICDIFEFVTCLPEIRAGNSTKIVGAVLFGFGCFSVVLYVYLVRIAILGTIICYVHKSRSPTTNDPAMRTSQKNALKFKIFFFIHMTGQMVVQMLMLVTIGRVFYISNKHFYEEDNTNQEINMTMALWYMSAAVTVLPVLGFFSFFAVTSFWVQQYPISFIIDLIRVLKMPGADDVLNIRENSKTSAKEMHDKLFSSEANTDDLEKNSNFSAKKITDKLSNLLHFEQLSSVFSKNMQERSCSVKFARPFKSPILILLCTLYFAAQVTFCYFAIQEEINETGSGFLTLNSNGGITINVQGWFGYYVAAGIAGFIFNLYAFAVPVFWSIVIVAVFMLVMFSIFLACIFDG